MPLREATADMIEAALRTAGDTYPALHAYALAGRILTLLEDPRTAYVEEIGVTTSDDGGVW